MNIVKLLLIVGCGGVFIFMAACCGGNYWISIGDKGAGQGLWKGCGYNPFKDEVVCNEFNAVKGWVTAVRAFSLLAVLATIAAGVLALAGLFTEKIKGIVPGVFALIAGLCMIIALSIYTSETTAYVSNSLIKYGWSFIMGWIGAIGAFACFVIGIIANKQ